MRIFLAILVTVISTVGDSILNYKFNGRIEAIRSGRPIGRLSDAEELEIARLRKRNYLVDLICVITTNLLMAIILDNWQTCATLLMIAMILPAFFKEYPLLGVFRFVAVVFILIIIWQLPSSQRTEELVVSEGVNLASFATTDGQMTDSLIIEDHGKYTLVVDDGPGKIRHETVPVEIVNGCYIDDEASSVATFSYTETYKRTFWSKKCTKLKSRELTAVYLYVKRWQIVNTFSVLRQS